MWNYMGWDNASTIATEVESPQRTYPRAMLVAVAIVALSYVLPFAAMWMTGLKADRLGDRFLGRHRRIARRTAAAHRRGARRNHQRLWHVQRSGHELFAPAAGDGAGWHVARNFCQAAEKIARPMGCDSRIGRLLGDVPGPGLRPPGDASTFFFTASACCWSLWHWSCCASANRNLPRPFRVPGGLFGAIAIGIPPMLLLGFAVFRSEHESDSGNEFLRLWHDSDCGGRGGLRGQSSVEAARMGSKPRKKLNPRPEYRTQRRKKEDREIPVLFILLATFPRTFLQRDVVCINYAAALASSAQRFYSVMRSLHAGRLPANNLSDIFR